MTFTLTKKHQIIDSFLVCPYCMTQVSDDLIGHCGESSAHFEKAYELSNGELILESETQIYEENEDI